VLPPARAKNDLTPEPISRRKGRIFPLWEKDKVVLTKFMWSDKIDS